MPAGCATACPRRDCVPRARRVRLEPGIHDEIAVVEGQHAVDAGVAAGGPEPGQRLGPSHTAQPLEAKRGCGNQQGMRQPGAWPRPLVLEGGAITAPHAHAGPDVIAHHDGRRAEGRCEKGRAGVGAKPIQAAGRGACLLASSTLMYWPMSARVRPRRRSRRSMASSGTPLALRPAPRTRVTRSCGQAPTRRPSSAMAAMASLAPPLVPMMIMRGPILTGGSQGGF